MGKRQIVAAAVWVAGLSLAGCGWLVDAFEVEETPSTKVTFHGKVAVPDGPQEYVVLSPSRRVGWQAYNCYKDTNDTALNNGLLLLESTNICSSAQWVYFYSSTPVNMSSYANGTVRFKLQVNNANQQFTLRIQDANTMVGSVNLANFGYDSSKVAVDQLIAVPVTALTSSGVNLSSLQRVFQLDVSCSADCYTNLSDIRWIPGAVLPAPFSPLAIRSNHCDPFPCRGLPRGRVGAYRASQLGWTAVPGVTPTTTDSDGNYTLRIEASLLNGNELFFIAVSDLDGTATLLSTIPAGSIHAGGTIEVDVDRSTTAVGMMVCPNGMTIPADGSGGWCIGDPVSRTDLDTLATAVDGALTTTYSFDLEVYWTDVVDEPAILTALNQMLADHGIAAVTEAQLDNLGVSITIPVVTAVPTSTTTGGTTTPTGNKQCQPAVGCDVCAISACVATTADGSSCSSWYETSAGGTFKCAACGDCMAAAQAAVSSCCPTQ